jgi:hypothetical protein
MRRHIKTAANKKGPFANATGLPERRRRALSINDAWNNEARQPFIRCVQIQSI